MSALISTNVVKRLPGGMGRLKDTSNPPRTVGNGVQGTYSTCLSLTFRAVETGYPTAGAAAAAAAARTEVGLDAKLWG